MVLPESTWLRLKTQLDCLPILLAGVADDALDRKQNPGKWSARENLAHLARYQHVFRSRLEHMLNEDRPAFPRYAAESDPEWGAWINRPATELIQDLRTQREELIREIVELTDEQLSRNGRHARFGEMTITQWLEFFLLHEAHHLLAVLQRVRE